MTQEISKHKQMKEEIKMIEIYRNITWWRYGSKVSRAFATAITQAVLIICYKLQRKMTIKNMKK